jgi:hypothetical protein
MYFFVLPLLIESALFLATIVLATVAVAVTYNYLVPPQSEVVYVEYVYYNDVPYYQEGYHDPIEYTHHISEEY